MKKFQELQMNNLIQKIDFKIIANDYILSNYGDEFTLNNFQDLENFYCFTIQSKKYINSKGITKLPVGFGYHIIYKKDRRVFVYNSGFELQNAINDLRNRIDKESVISNKIPSYQIDNHYSINLLKIIKQQIYLDTIMQYNPTYLLVEKVGDEFYKLMKRYSIKQFKENIKQLPFDNFIIEKHDMAYLLIDLLKNESAEFELIAIT